MSDHKLMAARSRVVNVEQEIQRAIYESDKGASRYAVEILVRLCRELYRVNESLNNSAQSRSYWTAKTLELVDRMAGHYPNDNGTWDMLRMLIQDMNKV